MALKIDTEVIRRTGTVIGGLSPGLTEGRNHLFDVEVRPGAFPDADQLRSKVQVVGVQAYVEVMNRVRGLVEDLDRELHTVSNDFADTESANTALADAFARVGARYGIPFTAGGPPPAAPSTTGPGDAPATPA